MVRVERKRRDLQMAEEVQGQAETSEAQIAVHWREEEYYPPPASFVAQANANDPAIRWTPRTSSPSASGSTPTC